MPSPLRTLERWGAFIGPNRHVSSVTKDDFVFWVAAETERGKKNRKPLKKSSIRRGLNTIKAALNHAVGKFPDLKSFQVLAARLLRKWKKTATAYFPMKKLNRYPKPSLTKLNGTRRYSFSNLI